VKVLQVNSFGLISALYWTSGYEWRYTQCQKKIIKKTFEAAFIVRRIGDGYGSINRCQKCRISFVQDLSAQKPFEIVNWKREGQRGIEIIHLSLTHIHTNKKKSVNKCLYTNPQCMLTVFAWIMKMDLIIIIKKNNWCFHLPISLPFSLFSMCPIILFMNVLEKAAWSCQGMWGDKNLEEENNTSILTHEKESNSLEPSA